MQWLSDTIKDPGSCHLSILPSGFCLLAIAIMVARWMLSFQPSHNHIDLRKKQKGHSPTFLRVRVNRGRTKMAA